MKTKMAAMLLALGMLLSMLPAAVSAEALPGFTDVAAMTDEAFFGVWNRGEEAWAGAGKLNYSVTDELSGVETCVKNGDYAGAKQELLQYFRTRSIGYTPKLATQDYPVDLLIDNIFTNRVTFLDKQLEIPCEYSWVEVDVTNMLQTVRNGIAAICMHPRKKTPDIISIASKESDNAPYVEAVINGETVRLAITQDFYIRAESYENENYGLEQELLMRDSGNPIDSDTMISFLQIDTSGLKETDNIVQAKLKLYAKTSAAEPQQLMLFRHIRDLDETTATFANQKGDLTVVSWQGIEGGTDWKWPDGYYSEFWYHFPRFYFLHTMAQMYYDKADEYYAWHAINMMLDFIQDQTVGFPRALEQPLRDDSFMVAFFALIGSDSMDAEACTAIMKYFWQGAEYLRTNFSVGSNWGTSQTKTFIEYAAVFPEFADQRLWIKTVRNRMENDIGPLILDDGSYVENSNSYAAGVLTTLKDVMIYAEAAGLEFSPNFKQRVKGLTRYLMDSAIPTGQSVEWGDGGAASVRSTILEMSEVFDDNDFRYFGSNGENGTPPEKLSALYPVGRRAFMRSGWNKNATFLFVNNYRGNIHQHSDALHIYLYAYGKPLLVDTGKASYDLVNDEIAIWQTYDTEAHNTVDVNGQTQENKDYGESAEMDITDYTDFYEGYTDSNEGVRHNRSILFIKPGYFIVSDLMEPEDETKLNSYSQTWHMPYRAKPSIAEGTKIGRSNFSNQANIQVVPADPESLTAELPIGWGVGDSRSTDTQEYLAYRQEAAGKVSYDTVLYPEQLGASDKVSVERIDTGFDKTEVSALNIKMNQNEAVYMIAHSHKDELKTFGEDSFDGRMAFYEKNSYGKLQKVSVSDGKNLTVGGVPLIKSNVPIANLAISYDAEDMYLSSGDENVTAAVYIPNGVKNIWLNGKKTALVRVGDYAYVGENGVRPDVELIADGSGISALFPELKLDKYIYRNEKNQLLYQLEIENGTKATGGADYDGLISLPYTNGDSVLVTPDYSVRFSKKVRIANYFTSNGKYQYIMQSGERADIPVTEFESADEALKSVPVVKVGSDLYTVNQLQGYQIPVDSSKETQPPVQNKPPSPGSPSSSGNGANSGNGGGGNPGGSPGTGTDPGGAEQPDPKVLFTDIKNHWAEQEITGLAEKKILNGVTETQFMPDKTVTRAEFAAMLVRAAELETAAYDGSFLDVGDGAWYANVIQAAKNYGLLAGFDGYVRPDDLITREEMAKMVVTACESAFGIALPEENTLAFGDTADISRWAYPYVSGAVRLGILKGDENGNFLPSASGTRAQAAVMIHRILSIAGGAQNED